MHLGPHGHLLLHSGLFSSLGMDSSNHYGNILSEDIHICANQHAENNGSHVLQSQPEGNQTCAHAVFHLHDFLFLLDTVCFDYCCGRKKFRKAFDELVKLNKLFDLCKAKKKVEAMEMTKTTTNSNDLLVTKTQHILSSSTTE